MKLNIKSPQEEELLQILTIICYQLSSTEVTNCFTSHPYIISFFASFGSDIGNNNKDENKLQHFQLNMLEA